MSVELKMWQINILHRPETTHVVCARYRSRAEQLYLAYISKYTATVVSRRVYAPVRTKEEQVLL